MVGMTDYTAGHVLEWVVGKTNMPGLPTAYLALFTGVGTDLATGFTEVSGGGYGRVATGAGDWGAASGTGPSSLANTSTLTLVQATADWGTVVAFGLYDAVSGGNLLAWDYVGAFDWVPFSVSSANPAVVTVPGHGFANGDLLVATTEFGGTFPTFSQSNFTGMLVVADATTDTFTLTNSGVVVGTSSTGGGMLRKVVGQSIPVGVQASFAPGNLVLKGA